MEKIVEKGNILKGIVVLLIVSVLLFSNLSVVADTDMDLSKKTFQIGKSSYMSFSIFIEGYETILDENFSDGSMPPSGWSHIINNSDDTWYIDDTDPHSEPYCGTCYHDNSTQDEWLITPSLNFSEYSEIYMRFWWYTSYYEAVYKDYHDLNVSISTDGGANWTLIWNEDTMGDFKSWIWYDTNFREQDPSIDLSAYVDETDVKIGFQYYSADGVEGREYSIDDIVIYGNSTKFECDTGGPYYYHWDYQPVDFRHASVEGGETPYTWEWDFGDGDTASTPPILTRHFYDEANRLYNVSLTVKDNEDHIAFGKTTVWIYTGDPPDVRIDMNRSGVNINAKLTNVGNENLSYIDWKIVVLWGPLKIFEQEVANGTIELLESETSKYISSKYFFGFGRITIIITAEPDGAPAPPERHFNAFKIGPFIFGVHQV